MVKQKRDAPRGNPIQVDSSHPLFFATLKTRSVLTGGSSFSCSVLKMFVEKRLVTLSKEQRHFSAISSNSFPGAFPFLECILLPVIDSNSFNGIRRCKQTVVDSNKKQSCSNIPVVIHRFSWQIIKDQQNHTDLPEWLSWEFQRHLELFSLRDCLSSSFSGHGQENGVSFVFHVAKGERTLTSGTQLNRRNSCLVPSSFLSYPENVSITVGAFRTSFVQALQHFKIQQSCKTKRSNRIFISDMRNLLQVTKTIAPKKIHWPLTSQSRCRGGGSGMSCSLSSAYNVKSMKSRLASYWITRGL